MGNLSAFADAILRILSTVGARGALAAIGVTSVVALFLIPLPPAFLDILLVINFVIAVSLMLSYIYFGHSTRFYLFPTLLLVTTLYRLALNVSSTRLILLYGDTGIDAAGHVIEAFGSFVVQGDFLVGAIIFAIIAIVNYIVVTRGSARVAEVAARFMLDAMPGKQLAIDSELRMGQITQDEATRRRTQLTQESQFYGAMDGAMKFVQGDAIAGVVIVLVNAVGGVAIGTISRGMELQEAVRTFGILTIGEGLVNILPALFISVCSGLVVTRIVDGGAQAPSTERTLREQAYPQVLVIVALLLFLLGLIPAFPKLPFFGIGLVLLLGGVALKKKSAGSRSLGTRGEVLMAYPNEAFLLPHPETVRGKISPQLELLKLELDSKLLAPYFERSQAAASRAFTTEFGKLQQRLIRERGVPLPQVVLALNEDLERGEYRVSVREQIIRRGTMKIDDVLVSASLSFLKILGFKNLRAVLHPVDYTQAYWVAQSELAAVSAVQHLGAEVISPEHFLALDTIGAALEVIDELVGLSEVRGWIEEVKREHPLLVEEVFGRERVLHFAEFSDLVRQLIREQVNVRDLKLILEAASEYSSRNPATGDRLEWLDGLHEYVRRYLSRMIIADSLHPSGQLRAFTLSPVVEEEFRSAIASWDRARRLPPLAPDMQSALRDAAWRLFTPVLERGAVPVVLLCSTDVRRAVHDFLDQHLGGLRWLRTMSYEELTASFSPETVGVLSV